jgi:hypothetical protein
MTKKTKLVLAAPSLVGGEETAPTRWIGTMCGCESRAAVRASRRKRPGEVRREHLDRDVAVELNVACEVDDAHAAAAELALKGVLTGEGGLKGEEVVGGERHVGAADSVAMTGRGTALTTSLRPWRLTTSTLQHKVRGRCFTRFRPHPGVECSDR